MHIIGVDFSGAEPETGKTWIAWGELDGDGVLTIKNCQPISRATLTHKLTALENPAVVAMDFPFSVPEVFAAFWHCKRPSLVPYDGNMTHLWAASHKMGRDAFIKFVKDEWKGEPKRICDLEIQGKLEPFSQVQSPLRHSNIPAMLQMTFEGMQMLNLLRCKSKVRIPPLHPDPEQDSVTLLEVMPGATVRSLVGKKYRKGYKGGKEWWQNRKHILDKLPGCSAIELAIPDEIHGMSRANDDALDAVVAAISAALWHKDRSIFHRPEDVDGLDWKTVRLEGWLYAPNPRR